MDGLGMIVRSDQGGIGAQSYELWRRLQPTQTLVVHLGPNQSRGASNYERFCANWTETRVTQTDVIPAGELRRWVRRSDRVLTIENMYSGDRGFRVARDAGVTTILVANPELYAGWSADRIAVPTPWELGRMPPLATVIPHPQKRHPLIPRQQIRKFVHHWAPAMSDRNGTQVVMDALSCVRNDCEVHIHAPGRPSPLRTDRVGRCRVTWNSKFLDDPWGGAAADADCLVLPRRYGGQCLPAMEAAARSMLLLMSDVAPQAYWPLVPLSPAGSNYVAMKGGQFPVYEFDPKDLARRMDQLIETDSTEVQDLVERTWRWVGLWEWAQIQDRWEGFCR